MKRNRGVQSTRRWTLAFIGFVLSLTLLAAAPSGAFAGTAEEINSLPTLDALNRAESPLSNSGKWSALAWDTSTSGSNTGRVTTAGWGPLDAFSTVNGAYWNPATFSDSPGDAAAMTMTTAPGGAERYVALWLDMSAPASAKTGYQLRWTVISGSTYSVTLSKWVAGTQTVLASNASVSIPTGTTLAISDTGGTVTAWQGTGGSLTSLLSAGDSTYANGYVGIEGSGNISRSTNFKAGTLIPPPDTTITAGPKGLTPPAAGFTFSASGGPTGYECSLDGGAFEACSSPATYNGLTEGSHTFRVRAFNGGGVDPTPAERSFQSLSAAKAVSKTALLDNFERSEVPLANGKFSKTSWASAVGGAWMGSYRGYGSSGGLAGAYWNQGSFSDGEETLLVSGTVGTGATPSGQYLALWLDMPEPGSARSGYEARFTGNGTTYTVELSKWVAGTRTVLASSAAFALPVGTTMALSETAGGRITLWTGTTSLTALLSANDSTYAGGYAGIEVNGGAGTIYNFRAGRIDLQAPETTIQSGPSGFVLPSEVSFAFNSSEAGSSFECLLDGGSYAACTSPKAYPGLAAGAHTFKVRATDSVANQDATPAERGFQVVPPPSVTTSAAAEVKKASATLKGSANPNGAATTYQFEYGTTTSYGSLAPASPKAIGSGAAGVEVSEPIAGLSAGTTYHYRLVAANGAGTSKGEDVTLTTWLAPVATTEAATELAATEATLNASVNPKGAATTYQFEYGPTTAYGSKAPAGPEAVGSGSAAVAVSKQIQGLAEGATYHYRVVAENEAGIAYGPDLTLTTLVLPDATTEAATAVEPEEATLNGTVDPNGSETRYFFQYGKTTAYGSQAPREGEEAGSGESVVEVEAAPDLEPETTYHYRVVAVSPAGIDVGQDLVTTTATASAAGGDNNGEFVNLGWSGDWNKEGDPAHLKVVQKSGAKMLRVGFFEGHQGSEWSKFNAIVCNAAKDGITIAPYFYTGGIPRQEPALGNFKAFVYEAVQRYGFGGSEWGKCSGSNKPIKYWEVFNEENWGANVGGTVAPHIFGEFFEEISGVISSADSSGNAQVILGGLLSVAKPKTAQEEKQRLTPGEFLEGLHMDHPGLVDAVAVHPYAFSVATLNQSTGKLETHAPRSHPQVLDLVDKVKINIKEVHEVLPGTPLWVNEIGWPTGFEDGHHLEVSKAVQAELIEASIQMMEEKSASLHIHNVFYYNDWDDPSAASEWAYHCGLQEAGGKFRPAFDVFKKEARGDQGYPHKTRNGTGRNRALAFVSDVFGWVDPEDLSSWYRFEYGLTTAYGSSTANFPAGFEAGEHEFTQVVTGLIPNTTYHYRIVSYNENGDVTYGEDKVLTTGPAITAHVRSLNGEYGWINVSGIVESTSTPINGASVNINFKKKEGGEYKFNAGESRQASIVNGEYSLSNWPVGKGEWQVNVVFPGQGATPGAETGPEPFTIKNGYQLVNKNSGRCLEIAGNSKANGAGVHQWECGDPATRQDQVFQLRPISGATYQLVARHSNRCIEVPGGATYPGAGLRQWECNGGGNQLWQGVPVETINNNDYVRYINQTSGLCLEVQSSGTGDGAVLVQNTCGSQASQLWTFRSVESNPVPTTTSLAVVGTVNGTPGQVTVAGGVDLGGYAQNKWVTVNYQKKISGVWQTVEGNTQHPILDGEGHYSVTQGVGVGEWRSRAIFTGEGPLEGSTSPYEPFNIQPGLCLTETFVTPSNPISSQPGFITISGHVNVNPECTVINERWLNVNYYKENGSGQYVYNSTDHPVIYNGSYSEINRPVGSGNWKVQAVFPAQDWYKESASSPQMPGFTIGANGWHIDNLGGTITADPEISSQGSGRLDVFVRGVENGMHIKSYSGSWGGWVPMGGVLTSGPGSVSWSSGRIDVVSVDGSSTISHWYWAGSGWAADNLGGAITADPDISSWGPNRLDVFARGTDNELFHKYWAGSWSAWEPMGGSLAGGPSAVSWGPNRIDVVARMSDNTIGHWYWAGAGWAYDNLGGVLTSDPAIASQGPGLLDVFARGTDNGLFHKWWAGGWSNWESMGGALTSGPGAVSWGPRRVDVVARGVDNSVEHWWYQG